MTRISSEWLHCSTTQSVCSALSKNGAQVLFVGGCVRNTLMGLPASDIDIATDATPDVVCDLAKTAGIKMVPTGIEHGTVTLVKSSRTFEVTTFRRDVSTDGRRATVSFSTDLAEDAARRDFTINALYAQPDGLVIDPLNGLTDLIGRRVRFIGLAQDRIREDYLRSLRYFRFHAWYGDQEHGFDAEALAAIAANLDGLALLSRERVGSEMLKLLAAPDPAPSLAAMRSTGVLGRLLPTADDRALAPLIHTEVLAGTTPDAFRRLAVLGNIDFAQLLRLSRSQSRHLEELRQAAIGNAGSAELGYRLGRQMAFDTLMVRSALLEQSWSSSEVEKMETGAVAQFPVTAADLMPDLQGPALGAELSRLERKWIDSGFVLDRDELLHR